MSFTQYMLYTNGNREVRFQQGYFCKEKVLACAEFPTCDLPKLEVLYSRCKVFHISWSSAILDFKARFSESHFESSVRWLSCSISLIALVLLSRPRMSSTSWPPWGSTPPSKRPSSTPEWTSTWGSRWTLKAPSLELISEKPPLVGLSCSYLVSNSIGKLKGCNIVFDNFLNLRRASKAKQRIPRLSASWAPLSDQLNELFRWARKDQLSIKLPSTFFKLNLIDSSFL